MVCIYCQSKTQVTNSRPQKRSNSIWRRRQCQSCEAIFTSIEIADLSASIVVSKEKSLEAFSRDKLLLSIHGSLKHRKTAPSDATALTDTIISQTVPHITDATIKADVLAKISYQTLDRFDKAAATHYKAFHTF